MQWPQSTSPQTHTPMTKKKSEEIDLEKELDKSTEEINTAPDFEEAEPEENEDDFEEDYSALMDEDGDMDESAPEPTHTKEYIKKTADRLVSAFDILQRAIMKPLYKKTMLRPGDADKAKKWARERENGQKIEDIVAGDYDTKERLDAYVKALETLPLSDDDKEAIADPLSELVEKYRHLQLSPEWALVFAVGIVMLPRLEPLLPNMKDLFKGNTE